MLSPAPCSYVRHRSISSDRANKVRSSKSLPRYHVTCDSVTSAATASDLEVIFWACLPSEACRNWLLCRPMRCSDFPRLPNEAFQCSHQPMGLQDTCLTEVAILGSLSRTCAKRLLQTASGTAFKAQDPGEDILVPERICCLLGKGVVRDQIPQA